MALVETLFATFGPIQENGLNEAMVWLTYDDVTLEVHAVRAMTTVKRLAVVITEPKPFSQTLEQNTNQTWTLTPGQRFPIGDLAWSASYGN